MTNSDLDELEKLCVAATPGPWKVCGASDNECPCGLVWSTPLAGVVAIAQSDAGDFEFSRDKVLVNAQFIAAARTALPALIDRVRELGEENEKLGAALFEKQTQNEAAWVRIRELEQQMVELQFTLRDWGQKDRS